MVNEPVTDYSPYPCPVGHYCVNGTRFSTEYPCPNGTYGPVEKLQSEEECSPCDPGKIHQCENLSTFCGIYAKSDTEHGNVCEHTGG